MIRQISLKTSIPSRTKITSLRGVMKISRAPSRAKLASQWILHKRSQQSPKLSLINFHEAIRIVVFLKKTREVWKRACLCLLKICFLMFINSAERIHQKRWENFLTQLFFPFPYSFVCRQMCFIFKSLLAKQRRCGKMYLSAHIITIVFFEIIKIERHKEIRKKSFMIYRNFIDFSLIFFVRHSPLFCGAVSRIMLKRISWIKW